MENQTNLRKILVLHGPAFEAQGILPLLREHYDIQTVEDVDEALEAMRDGRFDGVVAETADFLPLERGVVSQQAAVVLDTIGDGVCIVGAGGELVWANRRMNDYPPRVLDELRDLCTAAYEEFATQPEREEPNRGKRFSLMPDPETYFEVLCSPVRDRQGILRQVAAVVVNATGQRRQQRKLNAIDRAGKELVRLDRELLGKRDAFERLQLLEERIIRCSQDVLNYEHFSVMLLDKRSNRLDVVVSDGGANETPEAELFARDEGNGICGYVAATGSSYICQDVRKDPKYLLGLHDARSSLTVPLMLDDKVIGVLNAESRRLGAFTEEDRQFSEIFANYVALALHILDLLTHERYSAHTQVSDSICAEMTGPLNDIITEASNLMEDYIGLDELRGRLHAIVDTASDARQRMQQISQGARTGVVIPANVDIEDDPVLTGRKVLVADDEKLIRQTIRDVLVPFGCQVVEASDGAEARQQVQRGCFDLVISDIKMPGASGYEVFATARRCCPRTAVILITGFGYDPNHSIVRANREGLASVLMKPFKVKQLLEQCRAAIAKVPGE